MLNWQWINALKLVGQGRSNLIRRSWLYHVMYIFCMWIGNIFNRHAVSDTVGLGCLRCYSGPDPPKTPSRTPTENRRHFRIPTIYRLFCSLFHFSFVVSFFQAIPASVLLHCLLVVLLCLHYHFDRCATCILLFLIF